MNMTGERFIAAPREAVWAGLNNPEVLKACIPGCESIEKISDTQMKAVAGIKLGPVSAKFQGKVTLSDLDPPNGYKISGEGQSPAGFAKGGAEVRLIDRDAGTLLTYTVDAQVGGKIAQVGARLIDATAKSLAEQFFKKFAGVVEKPIAAPEPAASPRPHAPSAGEKPGLFARIKRAIVRLFSGSQAR
ncbi:MAG: carbon monoxide dehydrogenase [Alphaproteobacteria bacterium]|nr:carbon monoxide dehydrogenase [Alphaproteobacteria bacterium]